MFKKEIIFELESREYQMYLADEFIGYVRSYQEAEYILDEVERMIATSGIWYEAEDEKTNR